MMVLFVVFSFVARKTAFGRSVYAVGGNDVRGAALRASTFAGSASCSSPRRRARRVTGILLTARLGSGNAGAASGLEFDVIAAVVVGGTAARRRARHRCSARCSASSFITADRQRARPPRHQPLHPGRGARRDHRRRRPAQRGDRPPAQCDAHDLSGVAAVPVREESRDHAPPFRPRCRESSCPATRPPYCAATTCRHRDPVRCSSRSARRASAAATSATSTAATRATEASTDPPTRAWWPGTNRPAPSSPPATAISRFGVGDRVLLYHIVGCGLCDNCRSRLLRQLHRATAPPTAGSATADTPTTSGRGTHLHTPTRRAVLRRRRADRLRIRHRVRGTAPHGSSRRPRPAGRRSRSGRPRRGDDRPRHGRGQGHRRRTRRRPPRLGRPLGVFDARCPPTPLRCRPSSS